MIASWRRKEVLPQGLLFLSEKKKKTVKKERAEKRNSSYAF